MSPGCGCNLMCGMLLFTEGDVMHNFKYIFFDLDGTLTDTSQGITKSVQYALKCVGIDEKRENLLKFIGPPIMDSFRDYYNMDEEMCSTAVRYYRERYSVDGLYEIKLYDDVIFVLKELKARGKILAVATSKPEVYAKKICDYFELSQYLDCICGSGLDGSFYHKCDVINKTLDTLKIEPDEAIMVGDRKYDIIGAKQCNMLSIGVRCGFASDNELEDAGADYVVDNLSGLLEVHSIF